MRVADVAGWWAVHSVCTSCLLMPPVKLSTAEHFLLPPRWSGMHCPQTWSQHQLCGHFGSDWRFFCPRSPLVASGFTVVCAVTLLVRPLETVCDWLIYQLNDKRRSVEKSVSHTTFEATFLVTLPQTLHFGCICCQRLLSCRWPGVMNFCLCHLAVISKGMPPALFYKRLVSRFLYRLCHCTFRFV